MYLGIFVSVCYSAGTELRVLNVSGKCFTTEPYPNPFVFPFWVILYSPHDGLCNFFIMVHNIVVSILTPPIFFFFF